MSEENKNPLIEAFLKAHSHKQLNEAGGVNQQKTVNPTNKPDKKVVSGNTNNVFKKPELMNPSSRSADIMQKGGIASGKYKPASSVGSTGEISPTDRSGSYNINKAVDKVDTFARAATGNIGDVIGLTDPKKSEGLRTFNPGAAQAGDLAAVASTLMPGRGALKGVEALGKVKTSGVPKVAATGTSKPGPYSIQGPWGIAGQKPGAAPARTITGVNQLKNIAKDVTAGKVKAIDDAKPPVVSGAPKPASDLKKAAAVGTGLSVGAGVGTTIAPTQVDDAQANKKTKASAPAAKPDPAPNNPNRGIGHPDIVGTFGGHGATAYNTDRRLGFGGKLSTPSAAPVPVPTEKPNMYGISKGDTLSGIAQKNKVSVADLMKANQEIKDVNKIGVGQKIVIPKATNSPVYQGGIGTKSGPKLTQNIQKPKLKEETEFSESVEMSRYKKKFRPDVEKQGYNHYEHKDGSYIQTSKESPRTYIHYNSKTKEKTKFNDYGKLHDHINKLVKEETLENKLIGAFLELQSKQHSNIFEAAKKIKKLDTVGKEDEDIDNDGDKDKSDGYLHNRRKAIAKAMKEASDPNDKDVTSPSSMGIKGPDYAPAPKKKPVGGNSKVIQTGPNSSTVTKSTNEEVEDIDEGKTEYTVVGLDKDNAAVTAGRATSSRKQAMKLARPGKGDSVEKWKVMTADKGGHVKKIRSTKSKLLAKEEVEFSEAELAHIAAILEANPVAPVPDDYSGASNGVSVRDLSDETVAEAKRLKLKGNKFRTK